MLNPPCLTSGCSRTSLRSATDPRRYAGCPPTPFHAFSTPNVYMRNDLPLYPISALTPLTPDANTTIRSFSPSQEATA